MMRPVPLVIAAALVALAAACASLGSDESASSGSPATARASVPTPRWSEQTALERGLPTFARHCAPCHGETGLGDGPMAPLLFPPPRDFGRGNFRVVSTSNGVPTDADLARTIRDGMLGTAMPPSDHLTARELREVVAAVRELAVRAETERLLEQHNDAAHARRLAEDAFTPGALVAIPPEPPLTWQGLERGQDIYARDCAVCHGPEGRAAVRDDLVADHGRPVLARDLGRGLLKGGIDGVQIARRIAIGMPGTPMPATEYAPDDLWALVHHVQSLVDPDARERVARRHGEIVARRADAVLDTDPYHPVWPSVTPAFVRLVPMQWRDERPEGVHVQALHDGEHLAIRVSWKDATGDDGPMRGELSVDAAALQLAAATDPPFFGMGERDAATVLWTWSARYGLPTRSSEVRARSHRGIDVAEPWARRTVQAAAAWDDAEWHVVFLVPLDDAVDAAHRAARARDERGARLVAGGDASVAFAVWDASAGDAGAYKSVSVWQRLELDP